jgi:hypothetical protein
LGQNERILKIFAPMFRRALIGRRGFSVRHKLGSMDKPILSVAG